MSILIEHGIIGLAEADHRIANKPGQPERRYSAPAQRYFQERQDLYGGAGLRVARRYQRTHRGHGETPQVPGAVQQRQRGKPWGLFARDWRDDRHTRLGSEDGPYRRSFLPWLRRPASCTSCRAYHRRAPDERRQVCTSDGFSCEGQCTLRNEGRWLI